MSGETDLKTKPPEPELSPDLWLERRRRRSKTQTHRSPREHELNIFSDAFLNQAASYPSSETSAST